MRELKQFDATLPQCFAQHPVACQNIAGGGLSEWRQVHENVKWRFYSHGGVQHVVSILRAPNNVDVTYHGFRAVKTPCGDQSQKTFRPTWTVSQQLGVPDCNVSENLLQGFSRAASGNGVRLHSQHLHGSNSLVGCKHEDIRGKQQST